MQLRFTISKLADNWDKGVTEQRTATASHCWNWGGILSARLC